MEDRLFDLEEILYVFKKRYWVIIVAVLMTTSLAVLKVSKLQPTYSASAKVFIGKSNQLLDYYSQQEMQYYSQFITIFSEISRIDGFLDDTLEKNKINKSSLEVASALGFSSSENTPIVTISYSSWTDEQMAETLDAVAEELIVKVKEIMPETVPTLLSSAKVYTIYPNKTKLPVIAFMAGIILAIAIILVWDYLDTKVNSKKQLEKILPIPVIGEIPGHEKEFKRGNRNVRNKENAQVVVSRGL